MIVEAIFWFHPLVWWIGARLVEERERACDEEVIGLGNRPDVYAEAILSVCRLCVESPMACVSRVNGAGVGDRALAGPVAIGLAVGVGDASAIHAQPPAPAAVRSRLD